MQAETRTFNGVTYYRYPDAPRQSDRRYFKRHGKYLHRAVWEFHHGPIPDGCHIHHRDKDTTNNDLANLEAIAERDHIPTYHPDLTPDQIAFFKRVVQPAAMQWHQSEEGRAWHRQHAKDQYAELAPSERACEHCGKRYFVRWNRVRDRFCSPKCRSAARYASGVDDEKRTCALCGAAFTANKYSRTRFCSRACAQRSRRG